MKERFETTKLPEGEAAPVPRAVVLVEGESDRAALELLASRLGRHLGAEGVSVVAIGGTKNIRSALLRFGPTGLDVRLAGLCDEGEEGDYRRGLERAGLGSALTRADMEALGFFVCVKDLEDELIRALGPRRVVRLIEAQGEAGPWRTFLRQPAQQGRPIEALLRRFMGTRSGRKLLYARIMVAALDLDRIPKPLAGALNHV